MLPRSEAHIFGKQEAGFTNPQYAWITMGIMGLRMYRPHKEYPIQLMKFEEDEEFYADPLGEE